MEVIAIFDIGKTNKKFLLFNRDLQLVHQEESVFDETTDEDGFPCDDIDKIEKWMKDCIQNPVLSEKYNIKAINFCTYGASVVYLGEQGQRIAPLYNYLKPFPSEILEGFYEKYGGIEEFCRCTASPALEMLNLGLQILWLKKKKPEVFSKTRHILFFPQYLSYRFTGVITADETYVGCHTAVWDFDKQSYHRWLSDEGIKLPDPMPDSQVYDISMGDYSFKTGIGLHDSAGSLVPYLKNSGDEFILVSTGTWCISMNPFNDEPLTSEQLRQDCLCNRSTERRQIKSSRLFMGHIHDVNVNRLNEHFNVKPGYYKSVRLNKELVARMNTQNSSIFFSDGIPADYVDERVDLSQFSTFDEAYHHLMFDLCSHVVNSIRLIIPGVDESRDIYITGGFARNEIFTFLIAAGFPAKRVFVSEVDNASALGAAMVVYEGAFRKDAPVIDLGLKRVLF